MFSGLNVMVIVEKEKVFEKLQQKNFRKLIIHNIKKKLNILNLNKITLYDIKN